MNPVKYLRDTWAELKLVTWPNRQTTVKLTVIVIAISALVGAYVGGLDYLFTSILKSLLG